MSEEILEEALNASFITPEREFKGEKLAPYTEGSRLLLTQVRDDNDSTQFFIWSFIYMHILVKKDKKEAMRLAWQKDEFRQKIFTWIEGMSLNDRELAASIVSSIIEEANRGRVEIVPTPHKLPEMGNG